MSSKPAAIPLFADAYLADTMHLTTEEHGAYLLLLMAAWRQDDCSLPNDDRKLARIAGLSTRKWAAVRGTILDFWTTEGDRIFQARLRKERGYVRQKSEANRQNVSKRWERQRSDFKGNEEYGRTYDGNTPPPPPTYSVETDVSTGADAPPSHPDTADAIDVTKAVFDAGLSILTQAGKRESEARSLIGRWRKLYGDGSVLVVLARCQRGPPISNPVEWITKALQSEARNAGHGNGNSGNFDDNERDGAFAAFTRRTAARYAGAAPAEAGRQATGAGGASGELALAPPSAGRLRQG